MKILVSFKVPDEEKFIYQEIIDQNNEVIFLKELSDQNRKKELETADILFAWNLPREISEEEIKYLFNLKFIQLLSAGFDHLNFDLISKNVAIAANQGAYAEPMAEHTIAMILSLSKNLFSNHKKMILGEFDQRTPTKNLKNSVCGIIGYGSIGKAVANRLKNFGIKIFGINTTGKAEDGVEFTGTLMELDFVLKISDIIIISIPLNEKTKGLIGKRELELMKSSAILINVARGPIIKEKDLYEHLKTNPDFSAGIDAWWNEPFTTGAFKLNYPFFDLPNIIGSPHNSAIVPDALFEGHKRALENIKNYIEGKGTKGIINR